MLTNPAPGQSGSDQKKDLNQKPMALDCEEPSVSGTPSVKYDYIPKNGTDDSDSDFNRTFGIIHHGLLIITTTQESVIYKLMKILL